MPIPKTFRLKEEFLTVSNIYLFLAKQIEFWVDFFLILKISTLSDTFKNHVFVEFLTHQVPLRPLQIKKYFVRRSKSVKKVKYPCSQWKFTLEYKVKCYFLGRYQFL